MNSVGAPKGGRVHWVLLQSSKYIRQNYDVIYDYDNHNYFFKRKRKCCDEKHTEDYFTVTRTSDVCFRCMYVSLKSGEIEYQSFEKSVLLDRYMHYKAMTYDNQERKKLNIGFGNIIGAIDYD